MSSEGLSFTPTSHRASETNASGLKLASCAARMAQLCHRFPAYLCINFKGVSGKVGGDALPLSPSSSDVPQNLLPDVHTLCRLALKPPDAPLALQVERRPVSLHARRYDVALTTYYALRMHYAYNFHAYMLGLRCLPRPWRAGAWRARRSKNGRHWRNRRTPYSYLN